MGKLLKIVLGIVLAIVVLIVAAAIILPMVFDPNEHKGEIISAVKEHTGRDLSIGEPLQLSVFPWLGIETGGVVFGNAPGFGDQPFAKVSRLDVRVKLLPLLARKLEVDTLVLQGAELNLEKNAKGVTNWDDLAGAGDKEAKAKQAAPTEEKGKKGPGLVSFQIEGIKISDTKVSWRDQQSGAHYVLDKVHLTTGSLSDGAAVPVEAGFTLTSSAPKMTLVLGMETTASAANGFQQFKLDDLNLDVDAKGEGLPADGVALKLKANIAADLAADTAKISDLKLTGPETELSGGLDIAKLQTAPQLKGRIELSQTNLKQLAALFGTDIKTTDPKALTQVSASITLAQEGGATRLDPIQITLDDTKANGYVRLLNPKGPVVRAKLDVDAIDLDRYLPPKADAGQTAETKPAATAQAGNDDPFAALRPLDLQAEATVGKLVVSKAKMQDVVVKISSKGGVLKIDPIGAKLYEGTFDGKVDLDARSKTPKLRAVENLTGIQIGPLLKDMTGQDRLLGKGDVKLDISSVGLTEAEVRKSLSGKGSFLFEDGAYKGVNIAKLIRSATGQGAASTQTGNTEERTDFTELSGSFTARDGVINNPDLQAKSPLLRIDGKGDVNLAGNTIDYLLTTELVGSLQGQGGATADQLTGVPIPVRIKGNLNSPSYTPDLQAMLNAKAKQRLEEEKAKVRTKIEDKIKGGLGDKLKGLFGN